MFLPPSESIVEKKICPLSGEEFFVTDKDLEFYDKVSPVFNGKKYAIPSPTLSPDERQRRRLCFRNFRSLYQTKSDYSGAPIISMYHPGSDYTVYSIKEYLNDYAGGEQYGKLFDFSQTFFQQFLLLSKAVPKQNLQVMLKSQNSDFCNQIGSVADSYLSYNSGGNCKNIYFCEYCHSNCVGCLDCERMICCEYCYESVSLSNCYNVKFSSSSLGCRDSYFIENCTNCSNCIFCSNLHEKQYCIYNKSVTQKEYKTFEQQLEKNPQNYKNISREFVKPVHQENCENCIGDFLEDSKNCFSCFVAKDIENCRYSSEIRGTRDGMDFDGYGVCSEKIYECNSSGRLYSAFFCNIVQENCENTFYSENCFSVKNIFGSSGLKYSHHCILNTPYSVHEYEELAGKIIDHMRSTGEWGEFFPHELSPFGYNETVANEYFPMTKEEVKKMPRFQQWSTKDKRQNTKGDTGQNAKGKMQNDDANAIESKAPFCKGGCSTIGEQGDFAIDMENPQSSPLQNSQGSDSSFNKGALGTTGWNWYSQDSKPFEGTSITPLPIQDYDEKKVGFEIAQRNIDALLNGIIVCEVTKKPFKIIRQELAFYIENGIPIPTKHPDQRHKERMALRNPRKLFERTCAECAKEIITTYAPERPEKVVCEECYRKLVY